MTTKRFEITKDHLKLLKRMNVFDIENPMDAPMINQKAPYGTVDIAGDVLEILGHEKGLSGEYPQQQRNQAAIVHDQMSIVLQILLRLGEIRTGEFKRVPDTDRWVEI